MAETVKRPEAAEIQKFEPKVSQDNGDLPKATAYPSRHQRRSADHSPLHPYYQAKLEAKGNGVFSPPSERKGSSEGSHGLAPLTPLRSRLKSTPRGNETPDTGTSVPKFGEWDETDPSSADGYTQIFNLVREEKQGGAGSTPSMATDNGRGLFKNNNSKGCCCFPWGGN